MYVAITSLDLNFESVIRLDDNFLQRAVIAVPKNSILLIEDIDCAFPVLEMLLTLVRKSRKVIHECTECLWVYVWRYGGKSRVTLSGLLNILDGIGSEEGKIFFATVSYPSH